MAFYGNNPTATATVVANTNLVTVTGIDLTIVTPGMTINLGARDRKVGDAWLIASVAPSGTNGGTLTTQGSIPTAYNSVPFLIDTTGYLGTDASYAAIVGLKNLDALSTLLGVATTIYSGARQLVLDKASSSAIGRILLQIAGRSWGAIEQRSLTYTPSGGQATTVETLALRASPDGTTWTDALLVNLANGTGDLRTGVTVMAAASTVDLSSAPAGIVNINGAATIVSFGPGKNLSRFIEFGTAGAVLKHSAALVMTGGLDLTTQAGDCIHATSDGSGNWRVRSVQRMSGKAFVPHTPTELGVVRQGGGVGQNAANVVRLGWSNTDLLAQVDALELGALWASRANAVGSIDANGQYAIQRFPSGLAIVMGSSVVTLDANGSARVPVGLTTVAGPWLALVSNGEFSVFSAAPVSGDSNSTSFLILFPGGANRVVRYNWLAFGRWK
ncbi:hypothetical protein [Methylorubrum extorquens]|uniref:Uncharacterized protein n=1 Tax=Methylorubrum extorquens (strain CM4 / NCIMB 13688) TaxID=440085 RepID=B7KYW4_METC4|nr:hypothetical protein [Methylorubrum extorquens]ACK81237.1 hypothetical protein Mchl_0299 [Methylorubrum extorquens CM4]